MKAAVLTEVNKPLQILDVDVDPPKAGEARVKMKATGICMSDWHIMTGDWPTRCPIVLGHEAAGIVTELGPGPSHLSVGDHVIFSFTSHCGHCRYCNSGRSVLCNGYKAPGFMMNDGTTRMSFKAEPVYQMGRIGTFREEVVCSTENLISIRKDVPWTVAAIIGCSVATGIGAVTRGAKVPSGASVLVVGCGGVGLNIVQGARLVGARTVVAVDLLDNKLEYAKAFGATHTINGKTEKVVEQVRAITGGGVDYAFDAIGTEATVLQIVDAVAAGGVATMVGIPSMTTRAAISPFSMVFQEKTLGASFYGSVQPDIDFPIFADLYMGKKINLDALISRTFKLEEINEGFEQLRTGGVARGVIVFD
ncbi:Zn-dependent alcohol dehydrogenase [Bradyrhizobium mercantei]|uniref:Zn-dependent alcohol dehydrogenase n=1 Tax=Bradyrhizobium mercantei TaxID=1904807 RepID=UPI0009758A9C|nr:Zn-dependent alcohol dehydrogenase [Bradyrhizobium mercantei]